MPMTINLWLMFNDISHGASRYNVTSFNVPSFYEVNDDVRNTVQVSNVLDRLYHTW